MPAFEKQRTKESRDISRRFKNALGPEPTKSKPRRTAFESEPSIYEEKDDEENED